MKRRNVLRSVGAASIASGLGMSVSAAAAEDAEFTIEDQNLLTPGEVQADRDAIQATAESQALSSAITADTGRESGDPVMGFELEVDDPELASASPRLLAVPYKPTEKGWNDVSTDETAYQIALTGEQRGERVVAGTVGFANRQVSADTMRVDVYGRDGSDRVTADSIGVVESAEVSKPTIDRDASSDGYLKCKACEIIVAGLCVGVSEFLGRSACYARCIPIAATTLYGGAICGGLCYALTTTFGRIACASGGLSAGACYTIDFCG